MVISEKIFDCDGAAVERMPVIGDVAPDAVVARFSHDEARAAHGVSCAVVGEGVLIGGAQVADNNVIGSNSESHTVRIAVDSEFVAVDRKFIVFIALNRGGVDNVAFGVGGGVYGNFHAA